jgi:signal transduction histidine kinase
VVPFDPIEALLRAVGELPAELRRLIRLELPNSLPPATGDPGVLISIVAELVTNAVRAMPASATTGAVSHGAIEVQAGADANTVFLRVLDRGTGIDPTNTERAFERFWRARRAGDARGGVGLGLYLVRRLVERQNGWVSLRAREGGGTVAEVRLPRADGPLRRSGEA